MSITAKVNSILSLAGMKKGDLLEPLGMASKQTLSNKMSLDRWSADDLIKIAKATGAELKFIMPDGTEITIDK